MRLEADPREEKLRGLVVDGRPGWGCATYIDGTQADLQGNPEWRVSTADLLTGVLGIQEARQYPNHAKRLAGLMRSLGWRKGEKVIKINKKPCHGYTRPKAEAVKAPAPARPAVIGQPSPGGTFRR
jgi:hypothetical protein